MAPSGLLRSYAALLRQVRGNPALRQRGDAAPFPAPVAWFLTHAEHLFDQYPHHVAVDMLLAGQAFTSPPAAEYGRRNL